ncbi:MAG: hypothetical protein ABSG56_10835, partial [Bryobacteraceae bacterium]
MKTNARKTEVEEALVHPAAQAVFESDGGFGEDHLRAHIAAINAPIGDRRADDQEHQEHQREEDDGEFVDPQFVAREVEALARDVEAHQVE